MPDFIKPSNKLRALVIDLESMYGLAAVWQGRTDYINKNMLLRAPEVICWAARWTDSDKMMFSSIHHDGKEAMLQKAHDLISEADILIGYNTKRYDIKRFRNDFAKAGLNAPHDPEHCDLYSITTSQFDLFSNSLDFACKEFGIVRKIDTGGIDLWKQCDAGDAEAWELMKSYNCNDVHITALLWEYYRDHGWLRKRDMNYIKFTGDRQSCYSCGRNDSLEVTGQAFKAGDVRIKCSTCNSWDSRKEGIIVSRRSI